MRIMGVNLFSMVQAGQTVRGGLKYACRELFWT